MSLYSDLVPRPTFHKFTNIPSLQRYGSLRRSRVVVFMLFPSNSSMLPPLHVITHYNWHRYSLPGIQNNCTNHIALLLLIWLLAHESLQHLSCDIIWREVQHFSTFACRINLNSRHHLCGVYHSSSTITSLSQLSSLSRKRNTSAHILHHEKSSSPLFSTIFSSLSLLVQFPVFRSAPHLITREVSILSFAFQSAVSKNLALSLFLNYR